MSAQAFFTPTDGGFAATRWTPGPWRSDAQHAGPPAALLGRAIEGLGDGAIGSFALDLLGPVPVAEVRVEAEVVRPGRSVELREARLQGPDGRVAARARAWVFPVVDDGPGEEPTPLPHTPADGREEPIPDSWLGGYLDAIEWRWMESAFGRPGPAVVWMRPRPVLVEGEQMSPLQRVLCCVDSASGVSAQLDPAEWGFLNTELTVHLLRPSVGEWICLDAQTHLGTGAIGTAISTIHDEAGLVGRSAQALLVRPGR